MNSNIQPKYSAKQIAKWLIDRAAVETKNGGEYLTQLKLQKLLYYAKGFFYVFENEQLFTDELKAQKYGPVVMSIVSDIKKYGSDSIKEEFTDAEPIKDKSVVSFLEFIYQSIASFYAAKKLVNLTHSEKPWQTTTNGQVIKEELIRDYFRNTYLSNDDTNWIVSRDNLLEAMACYNVKKYEKAYKVLSQC